MHNMLDPEHEFYINRDAVGQDMRDQAIKFYNLMAYWNEVLGDLESKRKTIQSLLEQAKDKAKCERAMEASGKGFKAAIQDAYIRNIYDTPVDMDGELITPAQIQQQLSEIQEKEIEARSKVDVLGTAVDICRSALSWDKQEYQKITS